MPRVHFVKSARRPVPHAGINVGDSYYWWKFRFGGKRYSKTPPKPSQLTQSEFLSTLYDIQDQLSGASADDSLPETVSDVVSRLRDLASETEDKFQNMPESLQAGPTGELLQNRAQAVNDMADELEGLELEPDEGALRDEATEEVGEYDPEKWDSKEDWEAAIDEVLEAKMQEFWDERLEEVQAVEYQGE